jgi:hypothetical protein
MKKTALLFFLIVFSGVVLPQSEDQIVYQLFRSSDGATELTSQAINYAAQAIFGTKDLTGGFKSTGTITQTSLTPETWTYSASPTDKLIVKFFNSLTIEIVYTQANGYINGSYTDFVNSHTSFVFSIKIASLVDLNITSQALYNGNQGDNTVTFTRTIAGTYNFTGTWITVNLNNNGTIHTIVDPNYAQYATSQTATGSSSTTTTQTTVNEQYYSMFIFSSISSPSVYSSNKILTNNSSITVGGQTYKFQNAIVKWAAGTQFADSAHAGIYNQVIDINYWLASGSLLKNGVAYGNVYFDAPLILKSYGPKAVVQLANNHLILIHPILQSWVTVSDINTESVKQIPSNYKLEQNYPNPFNPATKINYLLPGKSNVTIKVYNIVGKEIVSLINNTEESGYHEVSFMGTGLPSGVYLYSINATSVDGKKNFISTKKMTLLK